MALTAKDVLVLRMPDGSLIATGSDGFRISRDEGKTWTDDFGDMPVWALEEGTHLSDPEIESLISRGMLPK